MSRKGMGSLNSEEDQVSAVIHAIGDYFEVQKKMQSVKDFSSAHPVVTVFGLVTAAMCSVPIICFFTFIFGSVFLAVTGFILIEGTVLTIATVVLGLSLLFVGGLAFAMSGIIILTFVAFDASLGFMKKVADRNGSKNHAKTLQPVVVKPESKVK